MEGRFEFSLKTPLTTHRSIDCFEQAASSGQHFVVLTSRLRVMHLQSSEFCCSVISPSYVCTIDPENAKSVGVSCKSKVGAAPDDETNWQGDVDDAEVEQIHDDGLSIGYNVENTDADGCPRLTEQDLDEHQKSDCRTAATVSKAREDGSLPSHVDITLFGETSCYTSEELEANAVESHLLRHDRPRLSSV